MSNPYNNEVIFNGQTLISLKEDTVTPDKVLAGVTFHDRSGAPQTGSLQERAGYYTLINQIVLTTQYTTHTLYNDRKFSDYELIVITPLMDSWARASSVISRNTFTQITGAETRFYQGANLIEVDVKYKSDTTIECKYIGNASATVYLFVYGVFKL